jgi:N-acetylglutamate synthase-like GNAT family acetyltransferase
MSLPVNLNRPFDPRLFLTDQELDRSAGLLISGASVLAKAAESARKKAGLSRPELQILMAARYRPGLTVSEMRSTLGMTVPTFARIIGKLDDRGLIEREVENFTVIEHDGVIFGCAALYPYPEAKTGEMAALTVSPHTQSQGDGERILKRIEQRARAAGLQSIFVLTTQTMHWFLKRGFKPAEIDWLPEARMRKYNLNRKSQVMVKQLGP